MSAKKYPFQEGDQYFTIEGDSVVQSVWDAQSEELYSISKSYFSTIQEAVYFYKMKQMQIMLTKSIECISNLDCDDEESNRERDRLLSDYYRLDVNPKSFSLIS
jgi:hypothetical protein